MFKKSVAAIALMSWASVAVAVPLNVSATIDTGTTITYGPGVYSISYVGTAGGGAYNAYSLYGNADYVTNNAGQCQSGQSQCRYGYESSFSIVVNGVVTNFALASDAAQGASHRFATDTAALSAAQAGIFNIPLTFSLTNTSAVRFYVPDTQYWDNGGGVSLNVTRTGNSVPEPGALALMASGLGMMGLGLRRSRKTRTAAAAA